MKAFLVITMMNAIMVLLYLLALVIHAIRQLRSRIRERMVSKNF